MQLSRRLEYVSNQLLQACSSLSLVEDILEGKWDAHDPKKVLDVMRDSRIGPAKGIAALHKARKVLNGSAVPPEGKRGSLDFDADVIEPVEE